jgi:hypothetical protein
MRYFLFLVRPVDPVELESAVAPPYGTKAEPTGQYWVTLESAGVPTKAHDEEGRRMVAHVARLPDPEWPTQRGGMVSGPQPLTPEERAKLPPSEVKVPKRRGGRR